MSNHATLDRESLNGPGLAAAGPRVDVAAVARQAGLVGVIVVLVLGFGLARPLFLDGGNLINVLLQSSVVGVLALGQTFVLITGGIDLSIGSTVAMAAVVSGLLSHAVPAPVAILGGIAVGALAGLANGLLITMTKITPFIITLGTMSIYAGLALIIAGGQAVYDIPAAFQDLLAGRVLGIPIPVLLFVLLTVVAAVCLRRTVFGEHLTAVGGNAEVARLAGINVKRFTASAYVLSGATAGLAGTILVARLGAADPTLGADLLLTAIAATVMGGTKLAGGEGSMSGAAFGAIIIATLTAGLTTLNVQAFYQQVAVGAAIIIALLVDQLARGRR
ncbi:ABC transporter permease [Sphaerisporangium sp. NPDC051017]|uniref:ABC transporter permease n=1 Tax=Sphaerisporangium sp. NPDC051017 TaxID=3154636 RepID=UPI003443CB94